MSNEELVASYARIVSENTRRLDHSNDPKLEANKRVVRRFFEEVINARCYEAADDVFSKDFYWPQFNLRGPEGVRAWTRQFHAGFPDVKDIIEMQVAEGDIVITLLTVYGTHAGPWLGWPATGKFVAFPAVGIDRVVEGKIVERSATSNTVEFMRAVGIDRLPEFPGDKDRFASTTATARN
jgi:predicted ester cyclase